MKAEGSLDLEFAIRLCSVSLCAMMRILFTLILMLWSQAVVACGRDSDCSVADGTYRIALPDGPVKGTVWVLHGWQGTSAMITGSDYLLKQANRRGLAVVAPHGLWRSWSFPGAPAKMRDDLAFLRMVKADVVQRNGLDPDRMVLAGFSMGGSMVWNVACYQGSDFAGYVPLSGAYWDPVPETCPSEIPLLFHVHGLKDDAVPFDGKVFGRGIAQSPVRASFSQWFRQGACGISDMRPVSDGKELRCDRRSCGGGVLELCVHDGGHRFRTDWIMRGWDKIAAIKGWH